MQPEENKSPEQTDTNTNPYLTPQTQPFEPNDSQKPFAEIVPEDDEIIKDQPLGTDDDEEETENTPAPVLTPTVSRQSVFAARKRLFIIGFAVVLLALGVVGYLLTTADKEVASSTNATKKSAVTLLGAEATVVDGLVEVSQDAKTWNVLKVGDQVSTNQSLRTGADGRAVVSLDDGSALRVNNSSQIKVVSLDSTNVAFTNISGEVYARVVPSKRTFAVSIENETYTAKGTAYKTVNRDTTKGVEVYHSAVAVKDAKTDVAEGKRYYQSNPDTALFEKTTDIPTDQLTKDAFLAWNLEQDKKTTEFADTLGFLTTLEQKKLEAAEKAAAAAKPTPAASTAGIKLTAVKTDTGIKLSWSLSGVTAEKGFKVLKSRTANPTFGVDSTAYVSSSTDRSYTWSLRDGKTYNFRVCTYTGESCTNYSNNASATAPLYTTSYPTPSGSLVLEPVSGKNVEWTLNGSAPNGYKLVWGTSQMPTYGSSSAAFYDKGATNGAVEASGTGTYYVRVCMYTGDGCTNYSNQITVEL